MNNARTVFSIILNGIRQAFRHETPKRVGTSRMLFGSILMVVIVVVALAMSLVLPEDLKPPQGVELPWTTNYITTGDSMSLMFLVGLALCIWGFVARDIALERAKDTNTRQGGGEKVEGYSNPVENRPPEFV